MNIAQWGNTVVSAVVALAALQFIVTYHRRAPWRSSAMGWYLMVFVATIGLLGTYTVVITATGLDGPAASVLRVVRSVLLLVVAGLLLQGTRVVRREQNS